MHRLRLAILTIVIVVTACSTMPNGADPGYTLDEGLVYSRGEGWELAMDIAVPEIGREPFPVVLYFYGNGWQWGDRGDYHRVVIPDMISHGYAVALVDCRGVPQFRYPSQIHDAKEAVRWLRAHAAEYGVDPDRVAVRGRSSGGYLALMLGLTEPGDGLEGDTQFPGVSSEVRCVVSQGALVHFDFDGTSPSLFRFLGGHQTDIPEVYEQASVTSYMGGDYNAPVLTVQGSEDALEQALILDNYMRLAHNDHILVVLGRVGHQFVTPDVIWLFLDHHLKR